jgi:hypothetical protein
MIHGLDRSLTSDLPIFSNRGYWGAAEWPQASNLKTRT